MLATLADVYPSCRALLFGTLAASVAATVPRAAEARDYREALAR